ncbi:MAG: peptide-methionine (S)-S-oxide reductase MsrA [Pseudomonadota bacterium]|nr:peptide-methionine (S)-S-oxide reductase MsrA [Pseudomonadota bacterium]
MSIPIEKRRTVPAVLAAVAALAAVLWQATAQSVEVAVTIAPPQLDEPAGARQQATALFAGGCYWGVQGVFQHVRGVRNAVSGYAGGAAATAHYEMVSSGSTGHAEAVQIVYDPRQVSYGQLLQVFFSVAHNPTELNRQGPDSGPQYRSAIFPVDAAQRTIAEKYIAQLNAAHAFARPLATRVEAASGFYPAEAYHQNYLTLHPDDGYIVANDLPKIDYLKKLLPALYRANPVLVGHSG